MQLTRAVMCMHAVLWVECLAASAASAAHH